MRAKTREGQGSEIQESRQSLMRLSLWTLSILIVCVAALIVSAGAIAQDTGGALKAREAFYGAWPNAPSKRRPANNPGQHARPNNPDVAKPTEAPEATPAAGTDVAAVVSQAENSAEAQRIPLGLRYAILKRQAGAEWREVDIDTVFRSGDNIRVTVEANDEGYLYIISQGASGKFVLLFPTSQVENGENRVKPYQRYVLPAQEQFTFEEPAGEERMQIILTREPIKDLEQKILRGSSAYLRAQNVEFSMDEIGRIRAQLPSRDLVVEKVADGTPKTSNLPNEVPAHETAVYVVDKAGGGFVAELILQHR